ncbi:hypothetical protein ALP17_01532 [Pseudomonas savastanoi]|uniref:Uncharacterized protein n=1 Tax=Pseudomonas savastanoi TaxID=29438 RepID=A0A3M5ZJW7_PSESS|nr:hypothetical protein ALP17_01532 [Pseudomonas savastanoi]
MGKQSRSKRASPEPMVIYRSHVAAFRSRYLLSFLTPIFMGIFSLAITAGTVVEAYFPNEPERTGQSMMLMMGVSLVLSFGGIMMSRGHACGMWILAAILVSCFFAVLPTAPAHWRRFELILYMLGLLFPLLAFYRSTASAAGSCACNGGLFDPNARRRVRRCGGAGISRCIVKACARERHCASSPGSTRTFSRPTKNPPKRVFPRPPRLPVGCLRGDGRSSLILVNSCSPLDGSNLTEDGPGRKWPNPSTACKPFAILGRSTTLPFNERAGSLWINHLLALSLPLDQQQFPVPITHLLPHPRHINIRQHRRRLAQFAQQRGPVGKTPAHARDHGACVLVVRVASGVEGVFQQDVVAQNALNLPRIDHEASSLLGALSTVLPETACAAANVWMRRKPVRPVGAGHGVMQPEEQAHQVVAIPLAHLQVVAAHARQACAVSDANDTRPGWKGL